jgi:hypothetical protein
MAGTAMNAMMKEKRTRRRAKSAEPIVASWMIVHRPDSQGSR